MIAALLAIGLSATLSACDHPDRAPTATLSSSVSLSPAADQVYECITAKGWNVELTWDGGIEANSDTVPMAQRDRYRDDADACWKQIDDRVAAMTPSEVSGVYEKEIATRACLLGMGYEVAEPPSVQSFVDSFFTDRWSAYGASDIARAPLPDDELRSVYEACPQPAWSLGVF